MCKIIHGSVRGSTYIHIYVHIHMYAYIYICTGLLAAVVSALRRRQQQQLKRQGRPPGQAQVYPHTHTHTHTPAYIHYPYTYIYKNTHTRTHTHTHIHKLRGRVGAGVDSVPYPGCPSTGDLRNSLQACCNNRDNLRNHMLYPHTAPIRDYTITHTRSTFTRTRKLVHFFSFQEYSKDLGFQGHVIDPPTRLKFYCGPR